MFMYYSPDPPFKQPRLRQALERRASSPAYQAPASYATSSLKNLSDTLEDPSRDSINRIPEALKQLLVDLDDPFAPSPVVRAPKSAPTSRRPSARRKHSDLPPLKPPPTIPIPRLPRPPPSPEVKRILAQPTLLSRPTHPRSGSKGDAVPSPVSTTSSSTTLVEACLPKFEVPSPASSIKVKTSRPHHGKPHYPPVLPPIPPLRINTRLSGVPSQMAELKRKSTASNPTPRPLGAAIDDAWLIAQARSMREGWGEDLQHGELRQEKSMAHLQNHRNSSMRRSVSSTSSGTCPSVTSANPSSPSVVSLPRMSFERSPISPTSPRGAGGGFNATDVQRVLSQPTLLQRKPTGRTRSHSTAESASPTHSTTHSISSEGPPSSFRAYAVRSPKDLETPIPARSKSRDRKTVSHDNDLKREPQRASVDSAPVKRGRLWRGVSLGLIR
ncbi:hypothetical protein BKA70DRAFT_1308462 [Coprinopsis sp. MPI-PUGE-AT-0042]|nr:hypothetical protein BKA70DRAFT_1308462 [Coprinopsis sp. MPI-PUGE-AT-0042]